MMKRKLLVAFFIIALFLGSCVKETYEMERLSDKISLTPTFGFPAVSGSVTLEDIVEPSDTVFYDEDNLVRLVVGIDSVVDIELEEIVAFDTLFNFESTQLVGNLMMPSFTGDLSYSLDEISIQMDPALRSYLVTHNNSIADFPAFSPVDMTTGSFNLPNFEYATFEDGEVEITITNDLPVSLDGIEIALFDEVTGSAIGDPVSFPAIMPGTTSSASVYLDNLTIHNIIEAEVTINGSSGDSNVYINLYNSGIDVSLEGHDLMVRSGRVIISEQEIPNLIKHDTLIISSENGEEIETIAINSGNLQFSVSTDLLLMADVTFTLPSAIQNDVPFTGSVEMQMGQVSEQAMAFDDMLIDLSSVTELPYNRLPYEYDIAVSSENQIIDFDSGDQITVKYRLVDTDIDYVKGFFGAREESITPDTLDLGIDGFLNKLSGSVYFADPSIRLDYNNSIGIPISFGVTAVGIKDDVETDLGYSPFDLNYPTTIYEREASGSVVIDRTNSNLPDLISSIPELIVFGGTAAIYPDGYPGERNSYVFGESKITGDLTFNLPMELRINNLEFTDTLANFFLGLDEDDNENGEEYDPQYGEYEEDEGEEGFSSVAEMIDNIKLRLVVDNGFPLGLSVSVVLYDSINSSNLFTLDLPDLMEPAITDTEGKVTSVVTSSSTVEIDEEFLSYVEEADKIILKFTLNTTGNGTENVKIFSDYSIGFKALIEATANLEISPSEDFDDNEQ